MNYLHIVKLRKSSSILLLLLSTGTFLSCASDPPPEKKKSDPIVGNWERQQEVFVFANDSMVINDFSTCDGGSSLVFMDKEYDQFFSPYLYVFISENNTPPCRVVAGKGTWTKISTENYSVHVEYYEENDPYNIGEETIEYTAFFPAPDSLHLHNLNKLEQHQTEMEDLADYYVVYTLDTDGFPDNYPPWL
ncbi:MAG TPA: hypothetical protein VFM65_07065 [Flavobacteriaceae bacterium]|nr:hypothetical protein [Flavobacteriaceae bacterium]